jgi:phage shock protein PspC (stress-responsive transcriptional regulator)
MTNAAIPGPPTTPPPDQSPVQHGRPAHPPLRRSGTNRLLGGVCGGLAEHSGIDALIWRMGMVALTLAGGTGILVYVLLWVLMEPAPRGAQDPVSAVDQLAERLHTGLAGVVTPPRRD